MENCTNGSGNCSEVADPSVFAAFSILMPIMGGLTFALSLPVIIALCATRSVAKVLTVFLISTLVSGLLISGTFTLSSLIAFVTVFFGTPTAPRPLCRFIFWLHNFGSVVRPLCVVAFSIMVLVVVRFGKKTIKTRYIVLCFVIILGLAILITIQYLLPPVYDLEYNAGAVCFPVQDSATVLAARLIFTVLLLTIPSWAAVVVCIVVPIIVLRYIKKNSVTSDNKYGKSMARLGLFLITGNLINAVGITISSIFVYVIPIGGVPVVYCIYAIVFLSLYPAPILIVAFLKPVRDQLKRFLMCVLHCSPPSKVPGKSEKSGITANMTA